MPACFHRTRWSRREIVATAPSSRRLPEAAAFARERAGWIAQRIAELPDATYRVYAASGFAGIALGVDGTLRPRRLTAAAALNAAPDGTPTPLESLES